MESTPVRVGRVCRWDGFICLRGGIVLQLVLTDPGHSGPDNYFSLAKAKYFVLKS